MKLPDTELEAIRARAVTGTLESLCADVFSLLAHIASGSGDAEMERDLAHWAETGEGPENMPPMEAEKRAECMMADCIEPPAHFCVEHVLEVHCPEKRADADIDAFWLALERSWDIEPREYFEKEAPKNGFGSPLAMAVHYMWKREVKQLEIEKENADATTLSKM